MMVLREEIGVSSVKKLRGGINGIRGINGISSFFGEKKN